MPTISACNIYIHKIFGPKTRFRKAAGINSWHSLWISSVTNIIPVPATQTFISFSFPTADKIEQVKMLQLHYNEQYVTFFKGYIGRYHPTYSFICSLLLLLPSYTFWVSKLSKMYPYNSLCPSFWLSLTLQFLQFA